MVSGEADPFPRRGPGFANAGGKLFDVHSQHRGEFAMGSLADVIAMLMDLAEQYPAYADFINQVIGCLQNFGG